MKSWKSRKFIVFAAALALLLVNYFTGNHVDEGTVQKLMALIVGWMVSQGIADVSDKKALESASEVADAVEDLVEAKDGGGDAK